MGGSNWDKDYRLLLAPGRAPILPIRLKNHGTAKLVLLPTNTAMLALPLARNVLPFAYTLLSASADAPAQELESTFPSRAYHKLWIKTPFAQQTPKDSSASPLLRRDQIFSIYLDDWKHNDDHSAMITGNADMTHDTQGHRWSERCAKGCRLFSRLI